MGGEVPFLHLMHHCIPCIGNRGPHGSTPHIIDSPLTFTKSYHFIKARRTEPSEPKRPSPPPRQQVTPESNQRTCGMTCSGGTSDRKASSSSQLPPLSPLTMPRQCWRRSSRRISWATRSQSTRAVEGGRRERAVFRQLKVDRWMTFRISVTYYCSWEMVTH